MDHIRVAFISIPRDEADKFAKAIVEKRLAACINIMPKTTSYYWYNDKVEHDEESLMIVKTTQLKIEALIEYVKDNHPYEVPEVIAMRLSEGLPSYIDWVMEETGK